MPHLTIGRLKEFIRKAELHGDLEDENKVFILQSNVAFEADVAHTCMAKAPTGGEFCVWYGLVFRIPGSEKK